VISSAAIDVHTHVVPASIPAYGGTGIGVPWPSIHHHRSCCAQVLVSGKVFREIEDSSWSVERRSREMTDMDITTQVLSPMPELLSYWFSPADATLLGRHVNGEIAGMVAAEPQRFRGLGMVPLQSPDAAVRELDHIMSVLKLDGVEIGTNVDGRPLGHPFFEPFFSAAEAAGAVIFVHPLRAAGRDQVVGPPGMEQVIAFPCETALAIASLITGGTLHRHPRLKLIFSHGGGAFAQVLPRLQHAWTFMPALRDATGTEPVELARRLFFDSLVYSPVSLRYLVEQFGASQIVIGTDYPYAILDKTPMKSIGALGLDDDAFQAIASGNAAALFRLPSGREQMSSRGTA
jgi:aminocarboxymuconate-semialdehyde decarboxylase